MKGLLASRDVVECKANYVRIPKSEDRFRSTFEQAPVGIAHTTSDGLFTRVNHKLCEILGYTSKEMLRLTFYALIQLHAGESDLPVVEQLLSGGPCIFEGEKRLFRKNGSVVWTHMTISLMRDSDRVPDYFIVMIEDITSRKLREAQQWQDIERFRLLEDSMPQMVWTARPDGSIDYYNRRWLEYTGLSIEQIQGWGWTRTHHPDDVQASMDRWLVALAAGLAFESEMRILRASDHSWRWHLIRAVPVRDKSDKLIQWIGTFTDINDQKAAEEAQRTSRQELEQCVFQRTADLRREISERQKAEDELRQLNSRLLTLRDAEQRRIARELHDSAGQLLTATTLHLASVAREAGNISLQAATALSEAENLIRETIREIRIVSHLLHPPLLDDTGLRLALQWYLDGFAKRAGVKTELVISDAFGRLSTDLETTIFRIVQECLTNIHRHSGSETAKVQVLRLCDEVRIEVEDQGKGIPPESVTGVGLRGMKERVGQFDGHLNIVSSGSGTTIIARMPLARGVVA
jgi:PAS domain S-box-containing protein